MAGSLIARSVARSVAGSVSRVVTDAPFTGGTTYLFRDDFATTEAAPIASPRTAEPGPGTMTVVQTDGELSVASGQLVIPAPATPAWDDSQGYHCTGIARAAGRILTLTYTRTSATSSGAVIGWAAAASISIYGSLHVFNLETTSSLMAIWNGTMGLKVYPSMTQNVAYPIAWVLRATGCHFLIQDSGQWKLVYTYGAFSNATMYPMFQNNNPAAKIDNLRVPDSVTWTPTALASDSFDRADADALGNTDGAGAEEGGGDGVAWTELHGDMDVASNRITCATQGGDSFGSAHVAAGASDVVALLTVQCSAAGQSAGIQGRVSDKDNQWVVVVDVDANQLQIRERNAGTWTTRASVASTINTATDYDLEATFDGQTIRGFIVHSKVCAYTSASLNETNQNFGVFMGSGTGQTADNFVVFNRVQTGFPNV